MKEKITCYVMTSKHITGLSHQAW